MNALARVLSIAVLGAASIACSAAPVQLKSALPPVPDELPCRDGVVSKACPMSDMISQRGLSLQGMFQQQRFEELDQVLQALCTGGTRRMDNRN